MSWIDRLMSSVGKDLMFNVLTNKIVDQDLKSEDWRKVYTGIMALSQIAEYIDEVSEITAILAQLMDFLNNKNPVIRYAVCHSLGQFA